MLLTTNATYNFLRKILVIVLNIFIVLISIVAYEHFKPELKIDGDWITDCNHQGFYSRQIIHISGNGSVATSVILANAEQCEAKPAIIVSYDSKLKQGLDSLPDVVLQLNTKIHMEVEDNTMALVFNILGIHGFHDWKPKVVKDITGTKFNDMPWATVAGGMHRKAGISTEFFGENIIVITSHDSEFAIQNPVVLRRILKRS